LKNLLFNGIGLVFGNTIYVVLMLRSFLVMATTYLLGGVIWALQSVAKALMTLVDSERTEHDRLTAEQQDGLSELNVLGRAAQVRDDALSRKVWTMGHTIEMNRIGLALVNHYGWEPARVHSYLRGVVESIPGLAYEGTDDGPEDPSDPALR
jgi:hypothetical protein